MQDFSRERHSVSRLTVRLVRVTKCRRKVFDDRELEVLKRNTRQAFATMDCQRLACAGDADHAHRLVAYPPKLPVSVLLNMVKGTPSRMLRQARADIAERYEGNGVLWSPRYFAASTGGTTLQMVKRYVEQQRASSSP